MHVRREPQTAAAKVIRIIETHARMGSAYFEFLSTRRETEVKQSRERRGRLSGSSMYLW